MELLLNLAWLLLALPAYWLWRASRSRADRAVTSLQCMLALGCALVVLFPVISASDDLHAMRTEMEESSASKRSMRHSVAEKSSPWNTQPHPAPAMVPAFFSATVSTEHSRVVTLSDTDIRQAHPLHPDGRGPPAFRLA